jgi:MoxR-like ATPase
MIKEILSKHFVFVDEMAEALELAIFGKKNCIIYGPGGHGKSEMVQTVIRELELENETFFQFFGEGMDESRLFGGLDFRKLEEEKVLEYHPERSFMNYRIAVFEELFDAPAQVLLALKDVLTARELRNGAQRFKVRTETIIVLTNKEPSEISELGPSAHALIERFPLQLHLRWERYGAKEYLALFEKIEARAGTPMLNGFKKVLADILAKATADGNFVSPRTAVHAYELCQISARMREDSEVRKEDMLRLKFLPGLEELTKTVEEDIARAIEKAQAEEKIKRFESAFADIRNEFNAADSPIRYLKVAKKLRQMQDELAELRIPDELTSRRNEFRGEITKWISYAQEKALETTWVR